MEYFTQRGGRVTRGRITSIRGRGDDGSQAETSTPLHTIGGSSIPPTRSDNNDSNVSPVMKVDKTLSSDMVVLRILVQRLLGDGGHAKSTVEIADRVSAARGLCDLLRGKECATVVRTRFNDIFATLSQVLYMDTCSEIRHETASAVGSLMATLLNISPDIAMFQEWLGRFHRLSSVPLEAAKLDNVVDESVVLQLSNQYWLATTSKYRARERLNADKDTPDVLLKVSSFITPLMLKALSSCIIACNASPLNEVVSEILTIVENVVIVSNSLFNDIDNSKLDVINELRCRQNYLEKMPAFGESLVLVLHILRSLRRYHSEFLRSRIHSVLARLLGWMLVLPSSKGASDLFIDLTLNTFVDNKEDIIVKCKELLEYHLSIINETTKVTSDNILVPYGKDMLIVESFISSLSCILASPLVSSFPLDDGLIYSFFSSISNVTTRVSRELRTYMEVMFMNQNLISKPKFARHGGKAPRTALCLPPEILSAIGLFTSGCLRLTSVCQKRLDFPVTRFYHDIANLLSQLLEVCAVCRCVAGAVPFSLIQSSNDPPTTGTARHEDGLELVVIDLLSSYSRISNAWIEFCVNNNMYEDVHMLQHIEEVFKISPENQPSPSGILLMRLHTSNSVRHLVSTCLNRWMQLCATINCRMDHGSSTISTVILPYIAAELEVMTNLFEKISCPHGEKKSEDNQNRDLKTLRWSLYLDKLPMLDLISFFGALISVVVDYISSYHNSCNSTSEAMGVEAIVLFQTLCSVPRRLISWPNRLDISTSALAVMLRWVESLPVARATNQPWIQCVLDTIAVVVNSRVIQLHGNFRIILKLLSICLRTCHAAPGNSGLSSIAVVLNKIYSSLLDMLCGTVTTLTAAVISILVDILELDRRCDIICYTLRYRTYDVTMMMFSMSMEESTQAAIDSSLLTMLSLAVCPSRKIRSITNVSHRTNLLPVSPIYVSVSSEEFEFIMKGMGILPEGCTDANSIRNQYKMTLSSLLNRPNYESAGSLSSVAEAGQRHKRSPMTGIRHFACETYATRYWSLLSCARFCVQSKLKTSFGNAVQLFASIEDALKYGRLPARCSYSFSELQRIFCLIDFVYALEIACFAAYEGFCTLPIKQQLSIQAVNSNQANTGPASVIQFFKSNRKVCEDWFSRIRSHIVTTAFSAGHWSAVSYYGQIRLQELLRLASARSRISGTNVESNKSLICREVDCCMIQTVFALLELEHVDSVNSVRTWFIKNVIGAGSRTALSELFREDQRCSVSWREQYLAAATALVSDRLDVALEALKSCFDMLSSLPSSSKDIATKLAAECVAEKLQHCLISLGQWTTLDTWCLNQMNSETAAMDSCFAEKGYLSALQSLCLLHSNEDTARCQAMVDSSLSTSNLLPVNMSSMSVSSLVNLCTRLKIGMLIGSKRQQMSPDNCISDTVDDESWSVLENCVASGVRSICQASGYHTLDDLTGSYKQSIDRHGCGMSLLQSLTHPLITNIISLKSPIMSSTMLDEVSTTSTISFSNLWLRENFASFDDAHASSFVNSVCLVAKSARKNESVSFVLDLTSRGEHFAAKINAASDSFRRLSYERGCALLKNGDVFEGIIKLLSVCAESRRLSSSGTGPGDCNRDASSIHAKALLKLSSVLSAKWHTGFFKNSDKYQNIISKDALDSFPNLCALLSSNESQEPSSRLLDSADECFKFATHSHPQNYKIWTAYADWCYRHCFSVLELARLFDADSFSCDRDAEDAINSFLQMGDTNCIKNLQTAISSYCKALSLADSVTEGSSRVDMDIIAITRILKIILKYSYLLMSDELSKVQIVSSDFSLSHELEMIPALQWRHVVPQLFSRLSHPIRVVRQQIQRALERLAIVWPRGVVFPAIVAENSSQDLVINDNALGHNLNSSTHALSAFLSEKFPALVNSVRCFVSELLQVSDLPEENALLALLKVSSQMVHSWQEYDLEREKVRRGEFRKRLRDTFVSAMTPSVNALEILIEHLDKCLNLRVPPTKVEIVSEAVEEADVASEEDDESDSLLEAEYSSEEDDGNSDGSAQEAGSLSSLAGDVLNLTVLIERMKVDVIGPLKSPSDESLDAVDCTSVCSYVALRRLTKELSSALKLRSRVFLSSVSPGLLSLFKRGDSVSYYSDSQESYGRHNASGNFVLAKEHIPMPVNPGSSDLHIVSIDDHVDILPTKTRPKRLLFRGSDGQSYVMLLKAREDLHLDQRIMQCLETMNMLLSNQRHVRQKGLQARCYSVTPISRSAGLIQWVRGATTPLFALYRDWQLRHSDSTTSEKNSNTIRPSEIFTSKVLDVLARASTFEAEKEGSTESWPSSFESLIAMNRSNWPLSLLRRVFAELVVDTSGDLIHKELIGQSVASVCADIPYGASRFGGGSIGMEDFRMKTMRFSKSVAVMSMCGYILGLGDRHLDNILMDWNTGELVHIDYNICFDRGLKLKIPECVPFRLSQNIERACGLNGVDSGSVYFSSAILCLSTLRSNREVLLSLLEAFIYDPLDEWARHASKSAKSSSEVIRSEVSSSISNNCYDSIEAVGKHELCDSKKLESMVGVNSFVTYRKTLMDIYDIVNILITQLQTLHQIPSFEIDFGELEFSCNSNLSLILKEIGETFQATSRVAWGYGVALSIALDIAPPSADLPFAQSLLNYFKDLSRRCDQGELNLMDISWNRNGISAFRAPPSMEEFRHHALRISNESMIFLQNPCPFNSSVNLNAKADYCRSLCHRIVGDALSLASAARDLSELCLKNIMLYRVCVWDVIRSVGDLYFDSTSNLLGPECVVNMGSLHHMVAGLLFYLNDAPQHRCSLVFEAIEGMSNTNDNDLIPFLDSVLASIDADSGLKTVMEYSKNCQNELVAALSKSAYIFEENDDVSACLIKAKQSELEVKLALLAGAGLDKMSPSNEQRSIDSIECATKGIQKELPSWMQEEICGSDALESFALQNDLDVDFFEECIESASYNITANSFSSLALLSCCYQSLETASNILQEKPMVLLRLETTDSRNDNDVALAYDIVLNRVISLQRLVIEILKLLDFENVEVPYDSSLLVYIARLCDGLEEMAATARQYMSSHHMFKKCVIRQNYGDNSLVIMVVNEIKSSLQGEDFALEEMHRWRGAELESFIRLRVEEEASLTIVRYMSALLDPVENFAFHLISLVGPMNSSKLESTFVDRYKHLVQSRLECILNILHITNFQSEASTYTFLKTISKYSESIVADCLALSCRVFISPYVSCLRLDSTSTEDKSVAAAALDQFIAVTDTRALHEGYLRCCERDIKFVRDYIAVLECRRWAIDWIIDSRSSGRQHRFHNDQSNSNGRPSWHAMLSILREDLQNLLSLLSHRNEFLSSVIAFQSDFGQDPACRYITSSIEITVRDSFCIKSPSIDGRESNLEILNRLAEFLGDIVSLECSRQVSDETITMVKAIHSLISRYRVTKQERLAVKKLLCDQQQHTTQRQIVDQYIVTLEEKMLSLKILVDATTETSKSNINPIVTDILKCSNFVDVPTIDQLHGLQHLLKAFLTNESQHYSTFDNAKWPFININDDRPGEAEDLSQRILLSDESDGQGDVDGGQDCEGTIPLRSIDTVAAEAQKDNRNPDNIKSHQNGNRVALAALRRVSARLSGRDSDKNCKISVEDQVARLTLHARNRDNLCRMYEGWMPWV